MDYLSGFISRNLNYRFSVNFSTKGLAVSNTPPGRGEDKMLFGNHEFIGPQQGPVTGDRQDNVASPRCS
jgi:hypothetical protein